jgi:hypothetical protein
MKHAAKLLSSSNDARNSHHNRRGKMTDVELQHLRAAYAIRATGLKMTRTVCDRKPMKQYGNTRAEDGAFLKAGILTRQT